MNFLSKVFGRSKTQVTPEPMSVEKRIEIATNMDAVGQLLALPNFKLSTTQEKELTVAAKDFLKAMGEEPQDKKKLPELMYRIGTAMQSQNLIDTSTEADSFYRAAETFANRAVYIMFNDEKSKH